MFYDIFSKIVEDYQWLRKNALTENQTRMEALNGWLTGWKGGFISNALSGMFPQLNIAYLEIGRAGLILDVIAGLYEGINLKENSVVLKRIVNGLYHALDRVAVNYRPNNLYLYELKGYVVNIYQIIVNNYSSTGNFRKWDPVINAYLLATQTKISLEVDNMVTNDGVHFDNIKSYCRKRHFKMPYLK